VGDQQGNQREGLLGPHCLELALEVTVQTPHPSPPPQGGREFYETVRYLAPPPRRGRG
jgi:hypothetical protein